jgi:hypothetical protein
MLGTMLPRSVADARPLGCGVRELAPAVSVVATASLAGQACAAAKESGGKPPDSTRVALVVSALGIAVLCPYEIQTLLRDIDGSSSPADPDGKNNHDESD